MFKKTLLSLAVASSLALTGCLDGGGTTTNNEGATSTITNPAIDGKTWPVFNPVTSELPIPNDLIFDTTASDGTFGITPDPTNPVITALNSISGASTVAAFDIKMSGKIDPTTVDGTAVINNGGLPAPNPHQSVFLLELDYASGDPLTGLTDSEPPTIPLALTFQQAGGGDMTAAASLLALAASPAYEAKVIDRNGTDYIRINPLHPLNPRKRYLVVITNDVKDINGDSIIGSPSYSSLADTTQPLGSSSLLPVRNLITKLWTPLAVNYFAIPNTARTTALTSSNIALTLSFTTSDDKKVLSYIAEPGTWFRDRITDLVKNTAAKAAIAGGATDYATVKTTVDAAYSAWTPSSLSSALAGCDAAPAGVARFTCAGTGLAGAYSALLPKPAAHTVTFGTPVYDLQQSALLSPLASALGAPAGTVSIVQGSMTIPYYLGVPSGSNGTPLVTDKWTADDTLATQLNTDFAAAGLSIPQANATKTTEVNYIFPFPKKTEDQTIPVLAIYPTAHGANMKTVIFQHGVTTDRSAAMAFGYALVAAAKKLYAQDIAVLAIDQPLHGVAPSSTATRLALTEKLLAAHDASDPSHPLNNTTNQQAIVDGVFSTGLLQTIDPLCSAINVDFTSASSIQTGKLQVEGGACDAEVGGAANGSTAMQNAVVLESTVANAGSTLAGLPPTAYERHFNFTADPTTNLPIAMDYDPASAVGVGGSGSLFINLNSFTTSRDNLREQVLDLLALRLSISNIALPGGSAGDLSGSDVYFIGHSLGTVNGMPFVAVANSTTSTADDIVAANMLTPGGGIVRLIENSPTFAPRILAGLQAAAGLTQGDADLETFFNVFQATLDTVDPINYMADYKSKNIKTLFSEVRNDQVIPNSAYPVAFFGDALPAPLAGQEPLFNELGTNIQALTAAGTAALSGEKVIRYTAGYHGTPAYPSTGEASEAAVFNEMVGEAVSMVLSGGAAITVTNPTYVLTDTSTNIQNQ